MPAGHSIELAIVTKLLVLASMLFPRSVQVGWSSIGVGPGFGALSGLRFAATELGRRVSEELAHRGHRAADDEKVRLYETAAKGAVRTGVSGGLGRGKSDREINTYTHKLAGAVSHGWSGLESRGRSSMSLMMDVATVIDPTANTHTAMAFCDNFMRRPMTIRSGRTNSMMSVTMFVTAVAMYKAVRSIQEPSTMVISQAFSIGLHPKISSSVMMGE